MLVANPITPAIGAEISGLDLSQPISPELQDQIYQALLQYLVIVVRGQEISPQAHLVFAQGFGDLDEPHPSYPHIDGFENIVLLANDGDSPPDTNTWHADLTFKAERPFASVLVARQVPPLGGDTLWSSCYAAYNRLSPGLKRDLETVYAVHDLGDFRNSFVHDKDGKSGAERLNENVPRFGHNILPLIGTHPVTGRKFLNFNESLVTHIVDMTTNESNALKSYLANHMNKPEDQMRWRWRVSDLVMWDNRVTTHYAVADYLPYYRCMHRISVMKDRRSLPTTI